MKRNTFVALSICDTHNLFISTFLTSDLNILSAVSESYNYEIKLKAGLLATFDCPLSVVRAQPIAAAARRTQAIYIGPRGLLTDLVFKLVDIDPPTSVRFVLISLHCQRHKALMSCYNTVLSECCVRSSTRIGWCGSVATSYPSSSFASFQSRKLCVNRNGKLFWRLNESSTSAFARSLSCVCVCSKANSFLN